MRTGMVVIAAVLAFVTSGCAAEEESPSTSVGDLFQEYIRAGDVKNDRFPGGSGEDRIANLASRWSVEEFQAVLFGTYECDDSQVATRCDLTSEATTAARDFAGPDAEILGRSVLVKHEDGPLELMALYVVEGPSGEARLIDRTGRTYTDLADFRANNELLTSADTMLTLRNITAVPGEGDLVTVTGHTPSPVWQWWLLGGIAALAVLGFAVAVIRRRTATRDRTTFDAFPAEENPPAGLPQETPAVGLPEENPTAGLAEENPVTGLPEKKSATGLAEETPTTAGLPEKNPGLAEEKPGVAGEGPGDVTPPRS